MSHPTCFATIGLVLVLAGSEGTARSKPPASRPAVRGGVGPAPLSVGPAATAVGAPASRPSSSSSEPVVVGNDLDELRRFEESAFPYPAARELPPDREGEAAPVPRPRPSAESPPPGIDSDEHGSASRPPSSAAPEPWLAKLARPDLPIRWDAKLIRYLEFYKSNPRGRAIMATWLRRAGRYANLIARALRRHQLPQSLLYVAMIESGFNPKITSHAGAAGLWQFMKSIAGDYGLARDHWVDERRNPEKSTEAALRYLEALHKRFGSWELALAAYNAGHGGVVLAMRKYNTNDYWQLCRYEAGLPWDTTLYVPKILAAAVVAANRGVFGFDQITPDPELSAALVAVPTSITLAQAASAAGVSKDVIEALNPELQRGRTPPGKSWLRVPKQAEQRFYAGLAAIKGQLARYKPYLIRLGDTLADVARAHGMTTSSLRALNGFDSSAELRPGLTILVPARPPRPPSSAAPVSSSETDETPGSDDDVALVPLPADKPSALPGRRRVFYRTVMGDSLEEVAHYLGVHRGELASWNALDPSARLVSGMVLQAFVTDRFDASKVVLLDPKQLKLMTAGSDELYSTYEERRGRKRIVYLIRDGDTLTSIGKRYGLTVGDLMRINRLGRQAKLTAGQKLVLYVDSKRLMPRRPPRTPDRPPVAESEDAATDSAQTADAQRSGGDAEVEGSAGAGRHRADRVPPADESDARPATSALPP